jgi:dihydroorotase
MAAAIAGGVTSLACPPDTDPPLDEPGLVEMLKHRARALNQAHVYPIGALTVQLAGAALTEMGELAEAGCVAFSQADAALADTELLRRAMQYAATFGHRLWLRPNDPYLGRAGVAHDGEVATRLGLAGIPRAAETIALATLIALARDTGARLHVCRLSCAESVAMVRAAKQEGLRLTCDVAVHHLHLSDVDIGWFDSNARLVPPLRTTRDRMALRAGLADGTVDLVCSDHAPVDDDGKQLPFGEAEPGATGLELLLPLTLKWAAEDGVALPDALARITSAPAQLIGAGGGDLGVGRKADVCVFDPAAWWTVDRTALRSLGKNTPFLGMEVPGRVRCTLVAGEIVYEA